MLSQCRMNCCSRSSRTRAPCAKSQDVLAEASLYPALDRLLVASLRARGADAVRPGEIFWVICLVAVAASSMADGQ